MISLFFVKVLDFEGPFIHIYHYEIISFTHNINLIGRTACYKPDRPPSGIASTPSRYAGTVRGPLRSQVPDFFARVIKNE